MAVFILSARKKAGKMLEDFNLNFEDIKYAYEENFSKDQKKKDTDQRILF